MNAEQQAQQLVADLAEADPTLALDHGSTGRLAEHLVAAGWTKPYPVVSRLKAERDRAVRQAEFYRDRLLRLPGAVAVEADNYVQDVLNTDVEAIPIAPAYTGTDRVAWYRSNGSRVLRWPPFTDPPVAT